MSGFIPKEKLTAYQRWELAAFDEPEPEPEPAGPPAPDPEPAPEPAAQPEEIKAPAEPPESPEPLPPRIALPTAAEIERIHDEAHAQGYSAGYEEGMAGARESVARIEEMLVSLNDAVRSVEQEVADQLLATALEIARQVLRQSLSVKPELILPVVREAVATLHPESGRPALLLHPDDAALIRARLGDSLTHNDWRIVDDPSMTRGGCRVELGGSAVDASVETRWKNVIETLGAKSDWLDGA
ncbi:MAG: flagellar assembly protein FliH [Candidatus Accumulibacter sp.]|jgi:flagellar assembly protein FliH|nr:flagellar assembly protein FliH [Accumulibacter sp.]